jgi:hypothetical protein
MKSYEKEQFMKQLFGSEPRELQTDAEVGKKTRSGNLRKHDNNFVSPNLAYPVLQD